MTEDTFESFKTRKLSEGYDQVLVREWEPGFANNPHEHPFDTDAVVARGEYWLAMNGQTCAVTCLPSASSSISCPPSSR